MSAPLDLDLVPFESLDRDLAHLAGNMVPRGTGIVINLVLDRPADAVQANLLVAKIGDLWIDSVVVLSAGDLRYAGQVAPGGAFEEWSAEGPEQLDADEAVAPWFGAAVATGLQIGRVDIEWQFQDGPTGIAGTVLSVGKRLDQLAGTALVYGAALVGLYIWSKK